MELNIKKSLQANIPGWNGKVLADWIGWFGEKNGTQVHRQSRYLSNDPSVIATQADLAKAAGFDGFRATVQGPTVNPFLHDASMKLWEACLERGMLYCYLLDPWIAKNQPNPTQAVIDSLNSADYQRVMASDAYLPEHYVCEFDLANSAGVNVAAVQAAFPAIPILTWHKGYTWPIIPADPAHPLNVIAILQIEHSLPTMKMGSATLKFNDGGLPQPLGVQAKDFRGQRDYSQSAWNNGPTHVIDAQGGNFFYDCVATIPASMPYVCVPTWSDYEEQTAIEDVIAMLGGRRLGK